MRPPDPRLITASMPSGVEHDLDEVTRLKQITGLITASMPSGVEHHASEIVSDVPGLVLITASMPSGVEHPWVSFRGFKKRLA